MALSVPISLIAVVCNKDCRLYMKGMLRRLKLHNKTANDNAEDVPESVETTIGGVGAVDGQPSTADGSASVGVAADSAADGTGGDGAVIRE